MCMDLLFVMVLNVWIVPVEQWIGEDITVDCMGGHMGDWLGERTIQNNWRLGRAERSSITKGMCKHVQACES